MLADSISDNVARLKEDVKYYIHTYPYKYPSELIRRIALAINDLDKIRIEIDSSDIEMLKGSKNH